MQIDFEAFNAPPPAGVVLSGQEVHIWRIYLRGSEENQHKFLRWLSAAETARADRFYFAKDRVAFINARGALRHILASYGKLDPSALQFHYNEYGKPELALHHNPLGLAFNLSHTDDWAVCAVNLTCPLGIDIENNSREVAGMALAERFFSWPEQEYLKKQAGDQQRQAFFAIWTHKEAFIKMQGTGLSYPLDQFSIDLPGHCVRIGKDLSPEQHCFLHSFCFKQNYLVALARPVPISQVKYWEFPALLG